MNKTKKQVISGYHRPVCIKCHRELHPETNGVGVLDQMEDGTPYQLFDADLWSCPGCGMAVVGGFGCGPIAEHHQPDFQKFVESYEKLGLLIKNAG